MVDIQTLDYRLTQDRFHINLIKQPNESITIHRLNTALKVRFFDLRVNIIKNDLSH